MSDPRSPAFQSIAQSVIDHRITTMFGLMGDANLFMVDHYVRGCGGTFVPVAYEGSAVLMAQAWSHVSGKIGVATVTHGPALTNCLTALIEGARGHVPMVLLAGDTPVMTPQNLQNIDQREVVTLSGAGFEQIRSPATAAPPGPFRENPPGAGRHGPSRRWLGRDPAAAGRGTGMRRPRRPGTGRNPASQDPSRISRRALGIGAVFFRESV